VTTCCPLRRCCSGACREGTHLVGHHREAPALFTGPGRLDGGVERQQVGLGGDAADHPEHAADLLGIFLHLQHLGGGEIHLVDEGHHAGGGRPHHLAGAGRLTVGGLGEAGGVVGVAGNAVGGGAEFVEGGDDLIGFAGVFSQDPPGLPGC
jgi:hypothetical protein